MSKYIKKEDLEKIIESTVTETKKEEKPIILKSYLGWVATILFFMLVILAILIITIPIVVIFSMPIWLELWLRGELKNDGR